MMTHEEEKQVIAKTGLVLALILCGCGYLVGVVTGLYFGSDSDRPEPQYDVNRVVKMHEEARQCAVELEEARDNVLVCGRLLKRALE